MKRRPSRPAQPCDNRCPTCNRIPWRNGPGSCDPHDVRGLPRIPHAWPEPYTVEDLLLFTDDNPCQCGTPVGGLHHWPCDIEVCPWADSHPDDGEQLLCCGCMA